ncbi:MAG: hypothetical protein ABIH00_05680 [Armatimonadota bacterium]
MFLNFKKPAKILAFFLLLSFFLIQVITSVNAQTKSTGTYSLKINGVTRWKTDYITIKKINSKTVEGVIGIDWSILQEARLPADYEKMHEIPFTGKVKENGNCIEFTVNVANVKEYKFTLYPMECLGKPALVGHVEIESLLSGGPPSIETGVFAVMK